MQVTDVARQVLDRVRAEREGELTLVIGNGCCDSTAPYLFADYLPGPNEQRVGTVDGVAVFIDERSLAVVRRHGGGRRCRDDPQPDSFSCEAEIGYRFVLERLPAV